MLGSSAGRHFCPPVGLGTATDVHFGGSTLPLQGGGEGGTVGLCDGSNQSQAKDSTVRNTVNTTKYEVVTGVLTLVVSEKGCEWIGSTEGAEIFFLLSKR